MNTQVEESGVAVASAVRLDTVELAALPPSKAEQIRAVFVPMADMLARFDDTYNGVMEAAAVEVTPEISARARRLRLEIAKVRIAAEKARKEIKEEYLLATRAIDGTNNILKWAISEKEAALEAIEKHAQRVEEERLAALHAERFEALAPYVDEVPSLDFSVMADDVWVAYLSTKQREHAERLEAERAAEAARAERERIDQLVRERERRRAPVYDFFGDSVSLAEMSDDDFRARLAEATERKEAHLAEQEKLRADRERLEKEIAEKEAARRAELARIEAEREAERARLAAEAKAERDRIEAERQQEREAAESERARLAELEAAELARFAAEEEEEKARAAAAAKAARAPVQRRLNAWVDSFSLPDLPGEKSDLAQKIEERFASFCAWAKQQIEEAA